MKQHQGIAGVIIGGGALLLASQPVWAAATQVTGVRLKPTDKGVQLVLETQEGDRPQIFTVPRRNAFVVDITNAQLRLREGNNFRQQNPTPGIASVAVTQLDANSIRVTVTGIDSAPTGQVASREAQAITLNFNTAGASVAASPPSPTAPRSATTPTLNSTPTAQTPAAPAPAAPAPAAQTPDILVPNPQITYEGGPAPAAGAIQPASPAPPFLPRAVAPPVGDIAVSEVDSTASVIDLGTSERIPRLLLRDAPIREVLSLLSRAANRNIVFVTPQTGAGAQGQAQQAQPGQAQGTTPSLDGTISLDIENEPLQDVFNTVLRITGLQANVRGNTVFVGSSLPEAAANIVVRSLRLNQVPVTDAANFLTAQGAETQLPITRVQIQTIGEGPAARTVEIREPDIKVLRAQRGNGPLILSGLSILADQRLNAITLVGDPRKVEIASAFLSQLDARRRQVAVNVKIVDVNLDNTDTAGTSFSFGLGKSFFTFDQGAAVVNFGDTRPATAAEAGGSLFSAPVIPSPFTGNSAFLDAQQNAPFSRNTGAPTSPTTTLFQGLLPRAPFGTDINPLQPGVSTITGNQITYALPQLFQFPTRFLSQLRAQIVSGNAKILTDPTLVIQEGETARVNLGQDVITNQTVQQQTTGNSTSFTVSTEKGTVGLTLQIQVNRIDDNGFVTLNVSPSVTAPGSTSVIGNGATLAGSVTISLLSRRDLVSGQVRLRDGQTLILSGIIQDQDRTSVSKVPILGDIPILGALFRRTNRTNTRAEVIVMLTPQILDDSANSPFGYRYRPGPEVQQMLQRGGFTPPGSNR
ncbi:AMIN domain-containing protein [Aerosakkonema funiforme]|uniref:AMIN domain-containing protein n=1 Tax=Aerosakkonema funiforme TaxID=1246630 RepID=UPI0035B9DCB9